MNLTRDKFKEIFLVFKNKALSGSTGKVDSRSKKGICCNILKMTSPSSLRTHWKNNIHLHMFLGTLSVILQSFNQSVQFSHSVMPNSLQPHGLQHAKPPYPSPTPRVYSNSCPLSWWCHPTILSSVVPFSSCLQSFPASGSFQMSQFFTSAGQSIGVSASATALPMNIQDWLSLGWTFVSSCSPRDSQESSPTP